MSMDDETYLAATIEAPEPEAAGHEIGHCMGLRHTDYATSSEIDADTMMFWDSAG